MSMGKPRLVGLVLASFWPSALCWLVSVTTFDSKVLVSKSHGVNASLFGMHFGFWNV